MKQNILLEICLESVDSVMAAERGGADRVELCADLLEGGTTPSAGTIKAARSLAPNIGICVMVRPRGGDFLYTDAEFASMREDVVAAKNLGADGIVFGLLRADGSVDAERTQQLVELAHPLPVTFHRAIDVSRDLMESLETIIASGVARVLTSGGEISVPKGAETLARMVAAAGERIVIMPGGGIRPENIVSVLETTKAPQVHLALEREFESPMQFRKAEIPMGGVEGHEYLRSMTSEERVREVVKILRDNGK